jgi:hypothetical protein
MKTSRIGFLALVSLALLGPAVARPLLLAPIRLSLPSGTELGEYSHPVIDGDTLLVSAITSSNGVVRHAVHIFRRASNGAWSYGGVLFEGNANSLHLEGGLAVVGGGAGAGEHTRVFERGPQGWTQTATIDSGAQAWDFPIGIDNGAIVMRRYRSYGSTVCVRADWVLHKVNGQWQEAANIGAPNCDELHRTVDVNDGRALIVNQPPAFRDPQPPADVLVDTGATSWSRAASLAAPPLHWFAQSGSIASSWAVVEPDYLFRNDGGNAWVYHGQLLQPEFELSTYSPGVRLRGNSIFMQGPERDYELPVLDAYDVPTEWQTVRVYRPRPNGFFDYYARLSVDFSVREWSVSNDGKRVVAVSPDNNFEGAANQLFVFEIPDSVSFAGTQQDDFERGNFSRWTPTAGQFGIAVNGATRVLRQSSLGGDAGAYLTAIDWNDQSIEADLRPLEFSGNDRWFGLVARRVDACNYYYVTLRASGTVSLRRVLDGAVTELAHNYVPAFVPGRNYRVRLEAVGDQLAVSIDGIPRVHVKDTRFTHGHPGIAGYRTRFETDNVIVSPATRLLVRLDTTAEEVPSWASPPADLTGAWTSAYDSGTNSWIERQSDTSGDARWFSRTVIGNQVISARVRPMSFVTTSGSQDPWVGIAAHAADAQNYWYLTLRRSGQVSLRRVMNGNIQVLANAPQAVTTGAWYDLRLEMIGKNIRAFVNGDLKMQVTDSTLTGGGRNALLMYKTAADAASYVAYQP